MVLGASGCLSPASGSGVGDELVDEADSAIALGGEFSVEFTGCSELASVGLMSYETARARVPAEFTLAPTADPTKARFVARIAGCDELTVDGHDVGGGIVAQIGIGIVAPEGDGVVNNYTLYYDTDSFELALKLRGAGVSARFVPGLEYDVDESAGTLDIHVPFPSGARYDIESSIVPPTGAGIPIVANWWEKRGPFPVVVKMNTQIPSIQLGRAMSELRARPFSPLRPLIGGSTMTFPVLDSYNKFSTAHMDVLQR